MTQPKRQGEGDEWQRSHITNEGGKKLTGRLGRALGDHTHWRRSAGVRSSLPPRASIPLSPPHLDEEPHVMSQCGCVLLEHPVGHLAAKQQPEQPHLRVGGWVHGWCQGMEARA